MARLSIIIVTYNRVHLLKRCLQSIEQSSIRPEQVLVGINGSCASSETFLKNYSNVDFLSMESRTPGEARNHCVDAATGDYIMFLDDDAELPSHYIELVRKILEQRSELDVFGGPDRTSLDAGIFEKALGITLTSPLATATTRYRHKSKTESMDETGEESNLILCNLWCRKTLFSQEKFSFNHNFFRNEENVLIYQLKSAGKRIAYFPDLYVYHKRRTSFLAMARAICSSGKHRMRTFLFFPKSFHPIYLVPSLFLLTLLFLLFTKPEWLLVVICAYLVASIIGNICLVIIRKVSFLYIPIIIYFQIIINLCYGLGMLIEPFNRLGKVLYDLARFAKKDPRKVE